MRPWLAVLAALALGGCAQLPPADDALSFEMRRDRLERVEAWRIRGRLAIRAGDEGRLARFTWIQDGAMLRLNIFGPLGIGSFEIRGTPPELTVTTSDETWQLVDAEAELSAWFGWWLPVTSLSSWLRGLPDPKFPVAESAFRATVLDAFAQRRWSVDYGRYMLADGLLVPEQIVLSHEDLTIELDVREWAPLAGPN